MELKEFIKTAITDVSCAVSELQESLNGTLINPGMGGYNQCTIHFDLCVESSKEGSADIKVISGEVLKRNENKISFDITISLPTSGEVKPPTRPVYGNDDKVPNNQNHKATQR